MVAYPSRGGRTWSSSLLSIKIARQPATYCVPAIQRDRQAMNRNSSQSNIHQAIQEVIAQRASAVLATLVNVPRVSNNARVGGKVLVTSEGTTGSLGSTILDEA